MAATTSDFSSSVEPPSSFFEPGVQFAAIGIFVVMSFFHPKQQQMTKKKEHFKCPAQRLKGCCALE